MCEDSAIELIESGCTLDFNGSTVLICAAKCGLLKVVSKLIESGCALDIQNKHGKTAFHYCNNFNSDTIIKKMINRQINDIEKHLPTTWEQSANHISKLVAHYLLGHRDTLKLKR